MRPVVLSLQDDPIVSTFHNKACRQREMKGLRERQSRVDTLEGAYTVKDDKGNMEMFLLMFLLMEEDGRM